MSYVIALFLFLASFHVWSNVAASSSPWNLPVIPQNVPDFNDIWNNTNGKKIPRHLWMAFKDVPAPSDRKEYLNKMINKNSALNWVIHLADNDAKLSFMEKYFPDTSVLWAYKAINPKLGNSAADIWRYSVLWLMGGLYMDDDSYFEASFDEVIGINDELILATEKNPYNDDCFIPSYRLSARSMVHHYNRTIGHLFNGRTIVSWAIFAAPRHPIMLKTLSNIIEIIRLEYIHKAVTNMHRHDAKWKLCMCTTGPPVLTASAREVMLQHNESGVSYTLHKRDFIAFGGVFKMADNHQDANGHYMYTMQKFNIPLLSEYKELDQSELEGRVISIDGKELFMVQNGQRRGFENYDAFVALKFHLKDVLRLSSAKVLAFPLNATLLSVAEAVQSM